MTLKKLLADGFLAVDVQQLLSYLHTITTSGQSAVGVPAMHAMPWDLPCIC